MLIYRVCFVKIWQNLSWIFFVYAWVNNAEADHFWKIFYHNHYETDWNAHTQYFKLILSTNIFIFLFVSC